MYNLTRCLPVLGVGLLAACSGPSHVPTSPVNNPSLVPDATGIGGLTQSSAGMVSGAIGLTQIHLDPETLYAELTCPRIAATQGDLYYLSVRPFFGPRDIEITGVTRGPGSTIDVDIQFTHPFDAPVDLNPPATGTKRIDLHIFDVTAVVLAEGIDSFFPTDDPVTTNASILANADGYREVGQTVDLAPFGITNANLFPYKLIGNIDTGNPTGNYAPTANGWTGAALQAPTGYDVFPQGGVASSTFRFDVSDGLSLNLVTIAKYMDPRSTPNPKSKRLPIAGDPTALQYILPEAAGDIQRLTATVTGTLTGGSSSEIADIDLTILDWDHNATVAGTFPNNANLNEISEASNIETIEVSAPQLQAVGIFTGGALSGTGPEWNSTIAMVNTDAFDPASSTEVFALVRVSDQQDADNGTDTTIPLALDEDLAPVATLPSTRYQMVRITVEPGNEGPTCPDYGAVTWPLLPVVGVPFSLDLDSAATPATDPDGISLYEIDYNNDGTYDSATNVTTGNELADFPQTYTYTTSGPQIIKLRITDNAGITSTTVCDLNATVEAASTPTLDPLPVPGGLNADMVNISATTTVTDNPDVMVAKSTGEVYFLLRRGSAPLNWVVYKSTDSAVTWGLPNTIITPFPSGVNTDSSAVRGISMGIMNDGRPCFVGMDAGFDLTFKRAASEAGTVIDFGPGTEGSQIETLADWYTPSVMPHPTNLNRVYILAKNNSSTLGANPWSSTLWVSNDATAPNPTFTQAGVMDVDGPVTNEFDPITVIDSVGNLHVAWCSNSTAGDVKYRKWNDGTQAWDGPEVVVAQVGTQITRGDDTNIAVNAADEPAIAFVNGSATAAVAMLVKYNSATGWTEPRQLNNTNYPNANSGRKYTGVAFDGSGKIHVVWREDGTLDLADDAAVTVFSADGRRKLTPDFNVHQSSSTVNDFTNARIQYLPAVNKMLVTAYANGTVTDGKVRFRTYSIP